MSALAASPVRQPASRRSAGRAIGWATAAGAFTVLVLGLLVGGPAPSGPAAVLAASVLARTTGMLAGYGIAVMLVLMARVPALERAVGAAAIARSHAHAGRCVVVLMLVHAVAATASWAASQSVDLAGGAAEVLAMPGMPAAVAGLVLLCAVGAASARTARRRVPHEVWHLLHLSTYLAAGLAFVHQLGGPSLAGRPVLQVAWSLLYTGAYGAVLRYRLLAPVLKAVRHRLRVERVVAEGPDVVSVEIAGATSTSSERRRASSCAGASSRPAPGSSRARSRCPRRRRTPGCD